MASEQDLLDRDTAVRAMLVRQVEQKRAPIAAPPPGRVRVRVVTGVVFAVVAVISALAIGLGAGRSLGPVGGESPTVPPSSAALPTASPPAGVLLGRFTSDDGPRQTHTIHPKGLAISTTFACDGSGQYFIHIPKNSDEGGGCGGTSGGSSDKGTTGSVPVTITTGRAMRWTLTIVGIPETYVTPRPVLNPTDSAGRSVRFCTEGDLDVRFQRYPMPDGVTLVKGGQLVFTNTSGSSCALAGYPSVRFLAGAAPLGNHTMEHTDERASTEKGLRPVILTTGGHAYSQVDWYLPAYYGKNADGPCDPRPVGAVRVDLGNDLAGAAQQGSFDVPIGSVTACLNGRWGVYGKYGQVSSTVFVDYSLAKKD